MDHALMAQLRKAIQTGTIPSMKVYRRIFGIYVRRSDQWVNIPIIFESEDDIHNDGDDEDVDSTVYISSYGKIARGGYVHDRIVVKECIVPPGALEQQALNYAIIRLLSTPRSPSQFPWAA